MTLFQRRLPSVPLVEAQDYGAYRVISREDGSPWLLGRGAMGLTYKAEDIHLQRPVALKLISPALTESRQARELFLSEARGAASLRHRNVAAVHHLGTQGETFFYVMEFVEGETVETLIRRQGHLEAAFALDIAQQTACALAAAGRRRLVHRDIKPANLMLTDEGDGALVVKVIDFGLCKSFGTRSPGARARPSRANPTEGEGFLGTPNFASPEQIRNDPAVDARSDFYSLGVSLWQMLTGSPPFTGSGANVREQHLSTTPPFERLPPGLAEPVRTLLARLLCKDPAGRPQTPSQLLDEIEGAAAASKPADQLKTWKVQGCLPLLGTLLANNYHLEALVSDDQAGPIFRAEDVAGQRLVSLRLLDRTEPQEPVLAALGRLALAPHPNLLADELLSGCRGQPFVVSEWVNGFPLSEVLRVRGGLTAAETQNLVQQAARALDHARDQALGALDLRPEAVLVQFTGDRLDPDVRRALPSRPLEEWPDFILKFRLRSDHPFGPDAATSVGALAAFATGLLGIPGVDSDADATGGKDGSLPRSDLSRSVPNVLEQANSRTPVFRNAGEFAEALTRASLFAPDEV